MRTRLLSLCDVQMYRSHLKEALHYQYPDHYGIVVKHLLRGLSHYSVLSVHLTVTNVVCWWSLLSQLIECHVSCCMSNNVEFCLSASHSCYAHLSSSQPSDEPFRAQWRATTPVFLTAHLFTRVLLTAHLVTTLTDRCVLLWCCWKAVRQASWAWTSGRTYWSVSEPLLVTRHTPWPMITCKPVTFNHSRQVRWTECCVVIGCH